MLKDMHVALGSNAHATCRFDTIYTLNFKHIPLEVSSSYSSQHSTTFRLQLAVTIWAFDNKKSR
jgi:hypothetical protein